MTLPPALLASTAIGLWLMAAPAILGTTGGASDSDHLVGALVVCVAVIAMAEVGRTLRWINLAFAAWLVAAPVLVSGGTTSYVVSSAGCGLALLALTIPQGAVRESYGTADRLIR